jgi:hypothetical protein
VCRSAAWQEATNDHASDLLLSHLVQKDFGNMLAGFSIIFRRVLAKGLSVKSVVGACRYDAFVLNFCNDTGVYELCGVK